jgi:hypothetical protein
MYVLTLFSGRIQVSACDPAEIFRRTQLIGTRLKGLPDERKLSRRRMLGTAPRESFDDPAAAAERFAAEFNRQWPRQAPRVSGCLNPRVFGGIGVDSWGGALCACHLLVIRTVGRLVQ